MWQKIKLIHLKTQEFVYAWILIIIGVLFSCNNSPKPANDNAFEAWVKEQDSISKINDSIQQITATKYGVPADFYDSIDKKQLKQSDTLKNVLKNKPVRKAAKYGPPPNYRNN